MVATQERIAGVVLDHLRTVIGATELCSSPYSHFYLEKAFPDFIFLENDSVGSIVGGKDPDG